MGAVRSYDDLMAEARAARFRGWDFGFLAGRVRDSGLPWSYDDLAGAEVSSAAGLLDIGTGGGETLAGILGRSNGRRPARMVATESWAPNVPVARERLEPLGISVLQTEPGDGLSVGDAEFDLILNRHSGIEPLELRRVTASGGVYLMQGVGCLNDIEFNEVLDGPAPGYPDTATLEQTVAALEGQGFSVVEAEEAFPECGFRDIGAVVYQLRVVAWQVPGFDAIAYDDRLRELDARIRREGEFVVRHHRYLVKAVLS